MGRDLARRVAEQVDDKQIGLVRDKHPDDPLQSSFKTLSQSIRTMAPEFALAMPDGVDPMQLVRDAITEARRNHKLLQCDQASVLGALMTIAQLGLRCAVLGHAWPVPFWSNKDRGYRAQMIVGYRGYRELVWRSGGLSGNEARERRLNDHFSYAYGTHRFLDHVPAEDDRGPVTHYYAVLHYLNGGFDFEVMSLPEIQAHRDRYASTKDKDGKVFGVWVEHFDGMARKTPYLRVVKRGPMTRQLELATVADGTVRTDTSRNNDAALYGEHPVIDTEPRSPELDELWNEIVAAAPDNKPFAEVERDVGAYLQRNPQAATADDLRRYLDRPSAS